MPDYMTDWFPFSVEEVADAFEGMGLERDQALQDARAMRDELREATDAGQGFGLVELGGFLDRVAGQSEDAARRVAAYREGRTYERGWDGRAGEGR